MALGRCTLEDHIAPNPLESGRFGGGGNSDSPDPKQGCNCRHEHTFIDEDAMGWLKRSMAAK